MRIARIAAALLLAAPALAIAAPAKDDDNIVVTGQGDVEEQIKSFVGALTPATPRGQIGRFERALCPRAVGFTAEQRTAVEARMRMVAEGAGIDVAKPDCRPNLLVIATPDRDAFMKELGRKHAYLFGGRTPPEIRKILAQPGSATAWQVEGTLAGDGTEIKYESDVPVRRTTALPSRIVAPVRPYIKGSVVVLDGRVLVGFTTTQVADYALMRALAKIDPAKLESSNAPTILRALDAPEDSEVPTTLTQWDFAFLKGLYSSADNLYAPSQRSQIRRAMEGEIGGKDEEGKASQDRPKG